jgi:hypothetical protein
MSGPTGIDMSVLSPTGPIEIMNPILALFPSAATGPVEPPHIATIEELMASLGAIVNKESVDKQTVSVLLNETRDILRAPLFQWATLGFPSIYIIQSFTIDPPQICSDGESRNFLEYLNYCLGKDLNDVLIDIRSKMLGIVLTVSCEGNTLRIHVTKN